MGALDNYSQHENISVYITPLENDMFNDISVSVFKEGKKDMHFPMNVAKTQEEIPVFFRDQYNKVHKLTQIQSAPNISNKTKPEKIKRPTLLRDLLMYAENVIDRFNDARFELTKKITKKFN